MPLLTGNTRHYLERHKTTAIVNAKQSLALLTEPK